MYKLVKAAVLKLIPLVIKKKIFTVKLLFKHPFLIFKINKQYPSENTVFLFSFPRSGSSWVGSILGGGKEARYLREPITSEYMQTKPNRISVFEKQRCDDWKQYEKCIKKASNGLPYLSHSVIKYPYQWRSKECSKPIVIKEVNPLIVDYVKSEFSAFVYLLRHPFSVAKSYKTLAWESEQFFEKKFSKNELEIILKYEPGIGTKDYWYKFGYMQGWIEAYVKNSVDMGKSTFIRYEELCRDPLNQFNLLFEQCGLIYSDEVVERIKASISGNRSFEVGDFTLVRKQSDMKNVKVAQNEKSNYLLLMCAYNKAIVDYSTERYQDSTLLQAEYHNDSCYVVEY